MNKLIKIIQKWRSNNTLCSVRPEAMENDYPQPHKNEGYPFIGKWAILSYFVPGDLMPPEDQDKYINCESKGESLYVCIAEEAPWVIIQNHQNKQYRVNPNRVIWVEKPEFDLGDEVETLNGTYRKGWISIREWHFKNKCYYYYIEIIGKKGDKVRHKRRYCHNELSRSI